MNISLIGPGSGDALGKMLAQARYFQSQGNRAQVYVQAHGAQAPASVAGVAPLAVESLTNNPPAHWAESELYIYHDPGPFALLESVRQIRRGLVLWDCHALPDPTLVHCADLCIVETSQLRAQLNTLLGYPLERIFVIQPSENETRYGEQLNSLVALALQDALPRAELPAAPAKAARPPARFDHLEAQADVMLRGYEVRSNIPLLGGLIAWTRKNVTSHLREPYLDPTLEQQVAFNRRLARELRALATDQADTLQRLGRMEGSQQQPSRIPQAAHPAEVNRANSVETVIEIRDPAIDENAVIQRLRAHVEQRRANGAFDIDPATFPPEALHPKRIEEHTATEVPMVLPGLNQAIVELSAQSHLLESRFASSTPIIGPLIVAARRAWNWMSTKWYVLPIIRQQSELNARQITLLSELAHWQEINAQCTAELQARIEELEKRLAILDRGEKP